MKYFNVRQRFTFHLFKAAFSITLMFSLKPLEAAAKDYRVADIKCDASIRGNYMLTATLRRPAGFRGVPIFADGHGSNIKENVNKQLWKSTPCQIFPDTADVNNTVFNLCVTDFNKCGVVKRNSFIYLRVWFPKLPKVVMVSDQEVIMRCKPPKPTIAKSIATGYAGDIYSISVEYDATYIYRPIVKTRTGFSNFGFVDESPIKPLYEIALFRETGSPSTIGRSSLEGGAHAAKIDSHELPLDEAVPLGTRLQLRAKINDNSAWKYVKLMEVSVSPDPEDANADGAVALIKLGCRNPYLASVIGKQPYHRYKDSANEVLFDFEAFLLSNMRETNRLFVLVQIIACMEYQDCHTFCMDRASRLLGKRRKRNTDEDIGPTIKSAMTFNRTTSSGEHFRPLAQHSREFRGKPVL